MSAQIPDYFSLFGLEPRFALDSGRLTRAYREVLGQVHPDRHAGAGATERRAAMQLASHANEAYRVLRSDTERAAYLCRSHGAAPDDPAAAPLPASFLEQQMSWRETLESARRAGDATALAALAREIDANRARILARVGQLIDDAGDYSAAAAAVRSLMFLDRLAAEIDRDVDRDGAGAFGSG